VGGAAPNGAAPDRESGVRRVYTVVAEWSVVRPERRRVNNGSGQMMAIDAIVECFDDPEEDAELVCRPRRVCSSSGSGDDSD